MTWFKRMTPLHLLGIGSLLGLAGCFAGGSSMTTLGQAKQVEHETELLGGPNAIGQVGDYLLQNNRVRAIVQALPEAPQGGVLSYGGALVDLDRVRFPGEAGRDRFGGVVSLVDGTLTLRPERVFILEDGAATGTATIRAEGRLAPVLAANLVQVAAAEGLTSSLSRTAPADIYVKTDYILLPEANYITVRTTFLNRGGTAVSLRVGDLIQKGSTVTFVSGGRGFGAPSTSAMAATLVFESADISYGYDVGSRRYLSGGNFKDELVQGGLVVPFGDQIGMLHGFSDLATYLAPAGPGNEALLEVPARQSAAYTRYVMIGEGDGEGIFSALSETWGEEPGTVTGRVVSGGEGVAGADVALLLENRPFAHFRTSEDGSFRATVPPDIYQLVVNAKGYPYVSTTPALQAVDVAPGETFDAGDIALGRAGTLRVFLRDVSLREDGTGFVNAGMPGRLVVRRSGADPSPDVVGSTWPFRPPESADEVYTVSPRGELALPLEPGDYELQGYSGPFYSMAQLNVAVLAAARTDRVLELSRVIDREGIGLVELNARTYGGDGVLSPGATVLAAVGTGVDLLVSGDTGRRTDLAATLASLDGAFETDEVKLVVSSRIGVAPGERVVAPGLGEFGAWPITSATAGETVGFVDTAGKLLLPDAILQALRAALPESLRGDFGGELPMTAIWSPFASPDAPAERLTAYMDAADPVVAWDDGTIADGENGTDRTLAGLGSGSLWISGEGVTFDSLSVFDHPDATVRDLALNAWFTLLNLGYNNPEAAKGELPALTVIGSGSTPAFDPLPAGQPRNLLFLEANEDGTVPRPTVALANERLRALKNVISNGPLVSVSAASPAKPNAPVTPGELLSVASSSTTEVTLTVAVQSPCWAPVDRIEIFANAPITEPTSGASALLVPTQTVSLTPTIENGRTGAAQATACFVEGTETTGAGFGRYAATETVTLSGLAGDSWIVVVVRGPGFVPELVAGGYVQAPTAIVNPIFVDVNGDAAFQAPCPGTNCPNSGTTRLSLAAE